MLKTVYVIQQSECIIIERLGSYSKTLGNGLNFVVPFFDQPRSIFWIADGNLTTASRLDLRETVFDVPSQKVITRDNVSIEIDALLYVQVIDPVKAAYEIANLPMAVAQLAQTSLRNVIGEMDLDHTLTSRDTINAKLKTILDEATDKWGTKVNRVELRNITPPREIQIAMEKQMQAEREAQIRRAEGEAQAIKNVADAKKEAFTLVKSAMGDADLTAKYLIATDYLHQFGNFVSQEGDKVFVPYEASTALGALGSIKELLNAPKK